MLRPADLASMLNGVLGVAAILAAMQNQVLVAYTFILVAIIMDGVDGGLARIGLGGGPLGAKLDTLCDLVSFVVAPAILAYTTLGPLVPKNLGLGIGGPALVFLVAVSYILAGMLRLARFDYLKGGNRSDYFLGLTTPGASIFVLSAILYGTVRTDLTWIPAATIVLMAFVSLLMLSRIRLPKVRGPMQAVAVLVLGIAISLGPRVDGAGALMLFVLSVFYLMIGPIVAGRHDEDAAPVHP
jgi:CDP-diacylglycerol---serine O-phosphatidyltransferase